MKNNILRSIAILSLALLTLSCRKDMGFDGETPQAVAKIISPADNAELPLIETPSAVMEFSWEAVSSKNASLYAVVFYGSQDGEALFKVVSNNEGKLPLASINHTVINRIASLAGTEAQQEGELWWSVQTSVGTREVVGEVRRKIVIKRLKAIAAPVGLFITGSATENGADLSDATPMRRVSKGVFEIYTQLSEGEYSFVDYLFEDDRKREFGLLDGALVEKQSPVTFTAAEASMGDEAYRITVDFAAGSVKTEKITDVKYHYPSKDSETETMTYEGSGKWKITGKTMDFVAGWGSEDSRYKFRATIDGTERTWGRLKDDDDTTPVSLEDKPYFRIYEHGLTGDNWHYSYRAMSALQDEQADIVLDMMAENYPVHRFEIGDITPYPVVSLDTPADNASVELNKIAGAELTFAWTPAAVTDQTPIYKILFYSDAAGTQLLTSIDAGEANSFNVSHSALESAAAAAGIASEGSGTIYWTIATVVFGSEAKPAFTPNALNVKRMAGIPSVVYVTGGATEYGANVATAGRMRVTASGKYEIYTKLSAGQYYFTDVPDATGRMFVVNGSNDIIEGSTPMTVTHPAVYRIQLDFLANKAVYQEISKVRLHFAPDTTFDIDFVYAGKGIWTASDYAVVFKPESGWKDERYTLHAYTPGHTPSYEKEIWGAPADFDRQPNPIDEPGYYDIAVIRPYTGDFWWDNKYKFHSSLDGKTVSIDVDMSPDAAAYRHRIYNIR